MSFPDVKHPTAASFAAAYFERLCQATRSVDGAAVSAAADLLEGAYERRAQVFVCGNGHSAAIANAFAGDHTKLVQTDTELKPRIQSLSANSAVLTALANDLSYADVFVYQLQSAAEPGDLLVTFSSSGNSENVVRAAEWARGNSLDVLSFTGFSGGRTRKLATVCVHVEADNYGVVEDTHNALVHVLAQYLRQARMSPALIADRVF